MSIASEAVRLPVLVAGLVVQIRLALRAEKNASLVLGHTQQYADGLEVRLAVRSEIQEHTRVPDADSLEARLSRECLDESHPCEELYLFRWLP